MPELSTRSLDEYEALAVLLATDRERHDEITGRLRRNRDNSRVFDTDRFCRHIERAYVGMWERWQRGEGPASFSVQQVG
jgi:predicted O-linked N-acetylglucosamine transferase (SPINDLY family)